MARKDKKHLHLHEKRDLENVVFYLNQRGAHSDSPHTFTKFTRFFLLQEI